MSDDEFPTLDAGPALTRVSTAVGERVLAVRAASGLSAAQLQVLRMSMDAPAMAAIAERLGSPKSTVTSVVDQLAAAGLVERAVDQRDRRRQIVRSTAVGERRLAAFDADVAAEVSALVAGLPPARAARLRELLAALPDPIRPVPLG
jgi:DNA-binding MarR family transcriptional regulator